MKEHLCRIRKEEKHIFISSLKLDTSLFDNQTTNLDWERQTILSSFCHDSRPENWEDILVSSDQTFIKDLIIYGQKNLIKVHMFISSPFAVHYERDIETTTISFVANIGGQSLVEKVTQSMKFASRLRLVANSAICKSVTEYDIVESLLQH